MKKPSGISRNLKRILVLTIIEGLWSCQEVIHVDLNSALPKLIIDGGVSDQPGPYQVVLSQTVSFELDSIFPPVSGAVVVITDNARNRDTLVEINPGTYQTTRLQGFPGRTYTLTVKSNNAVYTAISTMPSPVAIDTVIVRTRISSRKKMLSVIFFDPKGITNYYRVLEKLTNSKPPFFRIPQPVLGTFMTDGVLDGTKIDLLTYNQPSFYAYDQVLVSLQCIDKNVYDYFVSADQTGNMSTTVSNPLPNVSNGALGYFSAYAVRYKNVVIH